MDNLYRDLDHYKYEVTNIRMTYDLDNYDKMMKSAKRTEDWSEKVVEDITNIFGCLDHHMTCGICHLVMVPNTDKHPVMVLPCMHSFCRDCHTMDKKTKCPTCYKSEDKVIENI